MTAPRILVVIGTPLAASLNHALAHSYADAARAGGAEVRVVDLAEQPALPQPTRREELRLPRDESDVPLLPEVAASVADVEWADHLVFFFPQWWGSYPAALKNWIDRVFVSGFAHRYRPTGRLWDKLLSGRTARIVMTMDSPSFWNAWVYREAAIRSLRNATLEYCGVKVRAVTRLTEVRHRADTDRERWVGGMASLGATDAESVTPRAREAVAVG
ncbi:NAD(P)H-dependent oxidoreductase [Microbacterium sp. M3]|uniref:NAD(P)H-dependent oxidoreductase n=1 Tax=Microbacterium arthrosphaerae TaxID=792652 RepID=A0ABU4H2C6_9MICO|nr:MULTISPECIES: NAD(P)H-dependent oxidoreductase [Microbacterium]MDW4573476.1 NAD(P)H-dependent oxidoreductase [Microbacterium arthrosphaerae]MDW7607331.1 NAD(P)H-dependent oxidoreductase [Microbacterium sp. M3]